MIWTEWLDVNGVERLQTYADPIAVAIGSAFIALLGLAMTIALPAYWAEMKEIKGWRLLTLSYVMAGMGSGQILLMVTTNQFVDGTYYELGWPMGPEALFLCWTVLYTICGCWIGAVYYFAAVRYKFPLPDDDDPRLCAAMMIGMFFPLCLIFVFVVFSIRGLIYLVYD